VKSGLFIMCVLVLTSFAHGQACGPPAYPCFQSGTNTINYPATMPSFGSNTCNSTNIYTMAQCGNLIGANTTATPADFQTQIVRVTDQATNGNANTLWQTYDEPSVNAWNTDDSAFLATVNGGGQYVFLWNTAANSQFTGPANTSQALCTSGVPPCAGFVIFQNTTVMSWVHRDHAWSVDNQTGPGIYMQDNTITLTQGSGGVSTANTFDWTNSQCLMNTVNGYPSDASVHATINSWTTSGTTVTFNTTLFNSFAVGQTIALSGFAGAGTSFNGTSITVTAVVGGLPNQTAFKATINSAPASNTDTGTGTATTYPLNRWTGALGVTHDETTFAMPFSILGSQGSGYYQARWVVGQPGCRLWNTMTGVVTNNGVLVGTITDAPWGGAYGGKSDRWKIHDSNQPNTTFTESAPTQSTFVYGSYYVDDYFWDGGLNAIPCGTGAPKWLASTHYDDGDRVVPLVNNAGGYMYQIINTIPGTSGTSVAAWNQTPGSDTSDNVGTSSPLTWRNTGIGANTGGQFTIASWSLTSNSVTFTGVYPCLLATCPQYVAGNTPTISGLVHGSYLNGLQTVTAATATSFTISFTHANDSATEVGNAQAYFTYSCNGHKWKGALGVALGKNFQYDSYLNPQVPRLNLGPSASSKGDQHLGNTNNNTTDTAWFWIAASNVGTNVDLVNGGRTYSGTVTANGTKNVVLASGSNFDTSGFWNGDAITINGVGYVVSSVTDATHLTTTANVTSGSGVNYSLTQTSLPGALYGESFFIAPPYSSPGVINTTTVNQVRRAFHCFNSGWPWSFDARYCISVVSQTGKYALFVSDMFGQLGSRQNQASCNIGGPDYGTEGGANDGGANNYEVGSVILPNLAQNNGGNYIFQVLNCTANGGSGSACTLGNVHPKWPQGGTPFGQSSPTTIAENSPGTITWVLSPDVNDVTKAAIANCRVDDFVAILSRSGIGKASTIIQGNTILNGNVVIE
jgi:hypothetical protein